MCQGSVSSEGEVPGRRRPRAAQAWPAWKEGRAQDLVQADPAEASCIHAFYVPEEAPPTGLELWGEAQEAPLGLSATGAWLPSLQTQCRGARCGVGEPGETRRPGGPVSPPWQPRQPGSGSQG